MIENYLHFIVRLAVCSYVLYKVWVILFEQNFFGMWERILPHPKKKTPEPVITAVTEKEATEVVGKTTAVYLEDPALASTVPAHSEKLEPSGFIGEEPDISDDDVESDLSAQGITPEELQEEQERFELTEDLEPGLDPDFFTGLSFDQLANAVGVLTVSNSSEQQLIEAAKTIHSIKGTDIFEFIANQVSSLENVEQLLSDCLDENGIPLPARKSKSKELDLNSFNLSNYI